MYSGTYTGEKCKSLTFCGEEGGGGGGGNK